MPNEWRTCSLCGLAYRPTAHTAGGTPLYHDLIERVSGGDICRNVLLCLNRQQAGKLPEKGQSDGYSLL